MAEKQYSLKEDDGMFVDQDGISNDSPAMWLWTRILGGCGCGTADQLADEAVKLLNLFATPHEERTWNPYDDRFYEVLAHWFESVDLTEHGGSVGYSWLTAKGDQVHKAITLTLPTE